MSEQANRDEIAAGVHAGIMAGANEIAGAFVVVMLFIAAFTFVSHNLVLAGILAAAAFGLGVVYFMIRGPSSGLETPS